MNITQPSRERTDEIAIQADGLSKAYRITHQASTEVRQYRTLREDLVNLIRRPFKRAPRPETLWALRDVSFQVKRGEIVGLIGHNGAGKSTLLKLLSRITRPTAGSADIYGRLGSLLEVGTGFHAELTGRENVFLSGAVLGMSRAEIRQRFDDIVAFANIEKFIDTPVKRYSSGMYMRLAFAVAAHLETEILLIDEVLAVGDSAFQRKCLGKMSTIAQEGRTVLFVSHNMGAIADLCGRGIVLDEGCIIFDGAVDEAIVHYYRMNTTEQATSSRYNEALILSSLTVTDIQGCSLMGPMGAALHYNQPFSMTIQCRVTAPVTSARLNCILLDTRGNKVFHRQVMSSEIGIPRFEVGEYTLTIEFPVLWLASGTYTAVVKFRFLNPTNGLDLKIETPYVTVVVSGNTPRFGAALFPDETWRWQFSPGECSEGSP